jgi:hypothetical protein
MQVWQGIMYVSIDMYTHAYRIQPQEGTAFQEKLFFSLLSTSLPSSSILTRTSTGGRFAPPFGREPAAAAVSEPEPRFSPSPQPGAGMHRPHADGRGDLFLARAARAGDIIPLQQAR